MVFCFFFCHESRFFIRHKSWLFASFGNDPNSWSRLILLIARKFLALAAPKYVGTPFKLPAAAAVRRTHAHKLATGTKYPAA